MKSLIKQIALFLFLFSHAILFAQDKNVSISLIDKEPKEIKAGDNFTLPFKITNNTSRKVILSVSNTFPREFRITLQNGTIELNSGESYVNLIGIAAQYNIYADTFKVISKIIDRQTSEVYDICTVRIFVKKNINISYSKIEKPEFLTSGEPFLCKYQFTNRSNLDVNVDFSGYNGKRELSVKPANAYLRPGENVELIVKGETDIVSDNESSKIYPYQINYLARKNGDTVSRGSINDRILTYAAIDDDNYHKIPVGIKLRGIKENDKNFAYQIELDGKGKIYPGGNANIEFFARTPDVTKNTRLYYYKDEYRIGYHNNFLDLILGDKTYGLTQLTEFGRYGFGGEARLKYSGFELGGFQQRDRLYSTNYQGYATYLNYTYRDSLRELGGIGINFLNKTEITKSQIFSMTGNYKQFDIARLNFEYAQGSGSGQQAYQMMLLGYSKYFSYNAEYLHSSPEYMGSIRNYNKISGNLKFTPLQNLSFSAGYNQNKYNIDNDPKFGSAPLNKSYSAGFEYFLPLLNTNFSASVSRFSWNDELSPIDLKTDFNRLSSSISYRSRYFNTGVFAELNDVKSGVVYPSYKYERYGFNVGALFFDKHRLDVSTEYYHNNLPYYNNTAVLSGSAHLLLQITQTTRFNASYYTNDILKNRSIIYGTNYGYANLRLEQFLFKSHQLTIEFRTYMYNSLFMQDNNAVMAEYKIPIRIPISKRSVLGSLSGRLYDSENPELGISGVTLYADGKTAVTDRKGYYEFDDMKPDIYYLELNRLTLDPGKTTVQKTPIEVRLKTEEAAKVDIGVVRSASIAGKVMLYDFEERKTLDTLQQKIKESYGLPNFQIYMHNGRPDIYTATSDSRGKFDFRDLPPGHWVIKIVEGNYPDYHYLEKDSASFNLSAGEKKDLLIRVLPRVRPIKIAVVTDTIKTEAEIKPPVEVAPKIPLSVGVARRFNYDNWTDSLDAMTRTYLSEVAQYIIDNRNFIVSVEGHTDNIGGIAVTQRTSAQKAQQIRDYLLKKGVPAGNILTQGLGSRRPIAPNTTSLGRARNRRVEITIQRK